MTKPFLQIPENPVWVFDLDNTLYKPEQDIFILVDERMTTFIQKALNMSKGDAFKLQKDYWRDYGTTLTGLHKHHNIAHDTFLDYVHDIDIDHILENKPLYEALEKLQGKKYIFTNGTSKHAHNILTKLGIDNCFEDIFDIKMSNYIPKPDLIPYQLMLKQFHLQAESILFFEDMARNLKPAYELGMTTIWCRHTMSLDAPEHEKLSHEGGTDSYIDYIADDLLAFLSR